MNDDAARSSGSLPRAAVLAGVPSAREAPPSAEDLRAVNRECRTWLLVLDDDPTGTQAMAGVAVLLDWDLALLDSAAAGDEVTFVLTNTRSQPPHEAARRVRDVVSAGLEAGARHGRSLRVLLRGDSTLRGHHPLESECAAEALAAAGQPVDGVLIVPAFPEAGRITVDGVHWLCEGDSCLPVGLSEFARDATFGYTESNVRSWAAARQGIPPEEIATIGLTELRLDGARAVRRVLASLSKGGTAVADAASADDLLVLCDGLLRAEAEGRRFLVRCSPAFVRARAGTPAPAPARPPTPGQPTRNGGLVVVGSHTGLTTRQVSRATEEADLWLGELDTADLATGALTARTAQVVQDAASQLVSGRDVALQTSRAPVTTSDPHESLAFAHQVSEGLCTAVARLCEVARPAWVVAKGGITSADVAVQALAATRAVVVGPMTRQGISLWRLDDSALIGGLTYVVFPGNVGDEDSLVQVLDLLHDPGAT